MSDPAGNFTANPATAGPAVAPQEYIPPTSQGVPYGGLVAKAQPQGAGWIPYQAGPKAGTDLGSQVGAGLYSGVNSALFGAPDALIKTINSPTYQYLKNLRDANPVASGIGEVGGDIADMFIPGGDIAKAASLGAKGLGLAKTGEFLGKASELAKTGNPFMKGFVQTGEQAIPRALTDEVTNNGNPGFANPLEEGGSALASMGLGGVIGKSLGSLGGVLGKAKGAIAKHFGEQSVDNMLSGLDIGGGDIAKNLAYRAGGKDADTFVANNIDPFKKEVATFAAQNGITDADKNLAFQQEWKDKLKPVADAYDKAGINPETDDMQNAIQQHPNVKGLLESKDLTPELLKEKTSSVGGNSYWNTMNAIDNKISNTQKSMANSSDVAKMEGYQNDLKIYHAIKDTVQKKAFGIAPEGTPGLQEMQKEYPLVQTLRDGYLNNKTKIESAAKVAGDSMGRLSNMAVGGTVGNLVGGGMDQNGSDTGRTLGTVAGLAGGIAAPRLVPSIMKGLQTHLAASQLANEAGGKIGQEATQPTGPLSQAFAAMKSGFNPNGAAGYQALGMAPSQLPHGQQQGAIPNLGPQQDQGQPKPNNNGLQSMPSELGGNTLLMGGQPVQPMGQTRVDMNSQFGQQLLDRIGKLYEFYQPTQNGKPLSPQDYFNLAQQVTNGFSPNNPATINLLTQDPALRQSLSQSIPRLQRLTQNVNFNGLGGNLLDFRSNGEFRDLIADLNNKDPAKQPTEQDKKDAQQAIDRYRLDPNLSTEEKKQRFMEMLEQRGFPLQQLAGLGLLKGTPLEGVQ